MVIALSPFLPFCKVHITSGWTGAVCMTLLHMTIGESRTEDHCPSIQSCVTNVSALRHDKKQAFLHLVTTAAYATTPHYTTVFLLMWIQFDMLCAGLSTHSDMINSPEHIVQQDQNKTSYSCSKYNKIHHNWITLEPLLQLLSSLLMWTECDALAFLKHSHVISC